MRLSTAEDGQRCESGVREAVPRRVLESRAGKRHPFVLGGTIDDYGRILKRAASESGSFGVIVS